jgi:hypothetical protein
MALVAMPVPLATQEMLAQMVAQVLLEIPVVLAQVEH